jgi:tetratricopeptide (TPR) repeat protein
MEGIGFIRAAVARRPDSNHAVRDLGNGYAALRRHDEAIVYFRHALELDPKQPSSYCDLGTSLIQVEKYEEAILALERAIELYPKFDDAYAELAMLLSNCPEAPYRDPQRGGEVAAKAVEVEPRAGNMWTALGSSHYRLGRWREGAAALQKSLALEQHTIGSIRAWETEAINWLFLAMCQKQLGEMDEARKSYDRAIEWMSKKPWHDAQLRRLQSEAEELLNIDNQPQSN